MSKQPDGDGSSTESPVSHGESPYSSPSQQVPQLANAFSGITCDDITMHPKDRIGKKQPFLRLVEQPQDYFRFRYKSEMVGTHGCLLGRSNNINKNKTHPTVELVNYNGKAVIKCRLAQVDKDDEHPHKLFEDEHEDRDVSAVVPEQGSYTIGFAGMGIIHTAKKDVPALLLKKYLDRLKGNHSNPKELRAHCDNAAKTINLNIVRLRFSAHDVNTDKELCPPVFSEPIHNMKSAAVNDLKICRISRHCGKAQGGDDVFILVEKVNKKNIMVRFYELDENGQPGWSAAGTFLWTDVHHQYAIVFRTPAYKDPHIGKDVKVYIELVRPTDGKTSEPKVFTYKADPMHSKRNKRKRYSSSYSSLESNSSGSMNSVSELPTTIEMLNQSAEPMDAISDNIPIYQVGTLPQVPVTSTNDCGLADALYSTATGILDNPQISGVQTNPMLGDHGVPNSPMLGQPNVPEPPNLHLTSTEVERLANDPHIPSEERKTFFEVDWSEYMQPFSDSLNDKSCSMGFIRSSLDLIPDCGPKLAVKKEPVSPEKSGQTEENKNKHAVDKSSNEYHAKYTKEDGEEVKNLVREICVIMKNKANYKKEVIVSKLKRLMELRLSNGDTFLHLTLCSNPDTFKSVVYLMHSLELTDLLNLANDQLQTVLHLAILYDLPNMVTFLISKGCDPMCANKKGNNAFHLAVTCQRCLEPLLIAIKNYHVPCDLNAYNNEKQTALHVAAECDDAVSARALLRRGAAGNARDCAGRTALHLAAYDGRRNVAAALLDFTNATEIDTVDGAGNTALQIVCGASTNPYAPEIAKLLLDKQADPFACNQEQCEPAWRLAKRNPALWDVMKQFVPNVDDQYMAEEDIKSEPEDDYESADDGEVMDPILQGLSLYIGSVSDLLDRSGAWRQLAERTQCEALLSWYGNTVSPSRTLLTHLKESGCDLTSKSLMMILQDIGQAAAANIIRSFISE